MRSGVIRTVGFYRRRDHRGGSDLRRVDVRPAVLPASATSSRAVSSSGIGILLDTFLVRTITVPAVAVLIGRANWWPSRLVSRPVSAKTSTA